MSTEITTTQIDRYSKLELFIDFKKSLEAEEEKLVAQFQARIDALSEQAQPLDMQLDDLKKQLANLRDGFARVKEAADTRFRNLADQRAGNSFSNS